MKYFNVTFRPDNAIVSVLKGSTILQAAEKAGIILNTHCGGQGKCKKCSVTIEPNQKKVLACQYIINQNLTVNIPVSSRFFEQKILTEGIESAEKLQPDIYTKYLERTDSPNVLGVALDIGTTTVVTRLIDMKNGNSLAVTGELNPQATFGDDVISRIHYAESKKSLKHLQKLIIDCINRLIHRLCENASVKPQEIFEICVVGNTTMNHLFLGLPVKQLGQAPYKAFSLDAHDISPNEINLKINPAGKIHTVENIAGFVGADTTAVALATGINHAEQFTLAVDIGTNGEIILGTADKLYAASCAAGPALEGAGISCGSPAVNGAIRSVSVNEHDIEIEVIEDAKPRTICGSGIIDVVNVLLELGIIEKTGRLLMPEKLKNAIPEKILSRLIMKNNQPAFLLAKSENPNEQDVTLTQQDIRQIQLAKGAVRAGIKILQNKLNLKDSEIKHVFLAGAFGNYIKKSSALRISLLPKIPPQSIKFVGNAAASGAQMILLSRSCRKKAQLLASKIKYIEIAHEKSFTEIFTDSMIFP